MISVIIPCRDAAADLSGQLSALALQEVDSPWEVIIADNGSSDDLREVAGRFAVSLSIQVIDASGELGRPYACNAGAAAAGGELLLFLDADDEVEAGYVAAMARTLINTDAAAARLDVVSLNSHDVRRTRPHVGQQQELLKTLKFLPFGLGCSLGVRAEAFNDIGGFAEDVPYAEDVDFCWRLQLRGFELCLAPEAVLRYRYRTSTRSLFRQARNYGAGQVALYRKHAVAGMPRRSPRAVAVDWMRLARQAVSVRSRGDWLAFTHRLGYRVGRVSGSLRLHTLYL